MTSIFNYEFPVSVQRFREANVNLISLSTYSAMLEAALDINYIREQDIDTLKEWRKDPAAWAPGKAE